MTSRRLLALLAVFAALLAAPRARAQGTYSLQSQISSREVEVGETFTFRLAALVDQGAATPRSPTLKVPPGFVVHGPSVATQQQISLSGGQFTQRTGISATWTLEASHPGRFTIGPASVELNGHRVTGDSAQVEVVPAGAGKRQPNPFDPFGFGLPPMPKLPGFDDTPDLGAPELPPFPEELRVQHPDDPLAFLRAVAKPTEVVVGQQLTLKIYAYGSRGPFRETNTSEPSREAFLAHNILDNSYSEPMYRVPIGNDVWQAKKVRELALFPIQAGKLTIGSMRMGFDGRGYPSSGAHGVERLSAPLTITVTEPPAEGRPPGYKLGDVGRFALSASVAPRAISAGEAISIVAKLEGTGNLPFTLRVPQQSGVTWLEPTTVDEIEPHGSVIGGWRKFTYVVRIDRAGDVDLGEITLPYWDPERESYDTARAKLGVIKVKPANGNEPKEPEPNDALKDAITLRKTLGAPAASSARLSDERWFWWLLVLAPLGVTLTGQGVSLARRLGHKVRESKESHSALAAKALAEAARQASAGDVAKAASAAERAVLLALEGSLGLKARGLLRDALGTELADRGVKQELADEITSLLGACDDARFTGASETTDARSFAERAERAVREIAKLKKNGGANES